MSLVVKFVNLWKRKAPVVTSFTGKRYLLSMGINYYPVGAANLKGCLNDVEDVVTTLKPYSFKGMITLRDSEVTAKGIRSRLGTLARVAKAGDEVWIHYSGHGTTVRDLSGDEGDRKDEALYVYDGVVTDDELRKYLAKFKAGVRLILIMDCCHSGSITRAALATSSAYVQPRFFPTSSAYIGEPKAASKILNETSMNHVLVTGCRSNESSYDSSFRGVYRGALTYHLMHLIRKAKPGTTWDQLYKRLRKKLPASNAPQHPQLEGPAKLRGLSILS